jgi:hypothetical protein
MQMKTVLFIVTFVFMHAANAQEYKKFKVGFGAGFVNPALPSAVSVEAAYRLNNRMTVGYRLESVSLANNSVNSSGLYYQFYFSRYKNYFRPFLSLGVAQFSPGDMSGGCSSPTISQRINTEKKIGIFPSVGFDLGHVSIMLDANLAPQSKSTIVSTLPTDDINYQPPYTQYLTNSYVTLKLVFFIGGGKKKFK